VNSVQRAPLVCSTNSDKQFDNIMYGHSIILAGTSIELRF
jgi:hypothetical protein